MNMEKQPPRESLEEESKRLREENAQLKIEIKELHEENARLKHELSTDALTGLYSRRALETKIAESRENKDERDPDTKSSAVIMLDADHFRDFNTRYGHPTTDLILKAVAEKLPNEIFRKTDRVFRYGGEEIAVICEKADAERLINKFYDKSAEKPRLAIEVEVPIKGKMTKIEVTFSGGMAAIEPGGDLWEALIDADKALLRAKKQRDQLVLYSKDMDSGAEEELQAPPLPLTDGGDIKE